MSPPARKRKSSTDPLDAYRSLRKPVAPPTRVERDRRRRLRQETAEREAREAREAERNAGRRGGATEDEA